MTRSTGSVLIVEDEFLIAELLVAMVEDLGLHVCGVAATAAEAMAMAVSLRPELVTMDMRLRGEGDGVDAALHIHAHVGARVIFITGSREPDTVARIGTDHPAAVLFKPITFEQLRQVVTRLRQ